MSDVDVLYKQVQCHNADSTSNYIAVNEFLEVITTDRNKVPSATHQEESPQPAKEWTESTQNFAFVKEVCSTIAC